MTALTWSRLYLLQAGEYLLVRGHHAEASERDAIQGNAIAAARQLDSGYGLCRTQRRYSTLLGVSDRRRARTLPVQVSFPAPYLPSGYDLVGSLTSGKVIAAVGFQCAKTVPSVSPNVPRDTFLFSYNRGNGNCSNPPSVSDSCTDKSRVLFKFKACYDTHSESRKETLTCVGTWKEGSHHYLVGKVSFTLVD